MTIRIGQRRPVHRTLIATSALLLTTIALLFTGPALAQASEIDGGGGLTQVVSLAVTGMDLPRWVLLGVFVLITGVGLLIAARLVLPKREQQPPKPVD